MLDNDILYVDGCYARHPAPDTWYVLLKGYLVDSQCYHGRKHYVLEEGYNSADGTKTRKETLLDVDTDALAIREAVFRAVALEAENGPEVISPQEQLRHEHKIKDYLATKSNYESRQSECWIDVRPDLGGCCCQCQHLATNYSHPLTDGNDASSQLEKRKEDGSK